MPGVCYLFVIPGIYVYEYVTILRNGIDPNAQYFRTVKCLLLKCHGVLKHSLLVTLYFKTINNPVVFESDRSFLIKTIMVVPSPLDSLDNSPILTKTITMYGVNGLVMLFKVSIWIPESNMMNRMNKHRSYIFKII